VSLFHWYGVMEWISWNITYTNCRDGNYTFSKVNTNPTCINGNQTLAWLQDVKVALKREPSLNLRIKKLN